jgi:predicted DNA-binding transcriptional regulator AlpA
MLIDVSEAQQFEALFTKLLSAAAKIPEIEAELKRLSDAFVSHARDTAAPIVTSPAAQDDDQLLSAAKVVELLACGKVTLWRRIDKGTFPPPDVIVGKKLRYWKRSTYRKYLAQRGAVSIQGNPET